MSKNHAQVAQGNLKLSRIKGIPLTHEFSTVGSI